MDDLPVPDPPVPDPPGTGGSGISGGEPAGGIERAVFGDVSRSYIDDWLCRFTQSRLAQPVLEVFARTGRVTAVYGLRLGDGSRVAAKIHRSPASVQRLADAAVCQRVLRSADFPCPRPVTDPASWDSRVITVESWQDQGGPANPREPAIRLAMAGALARQVQALRSVPACSLARDRPAWTRYESGPWPVPHDSFFDFTVTSPGYEWLDQLAREASAVLQRAPCPDPVTAHGDWVCQNLRFDRGALVAAFDWDSLIQAGEPVIAGLSAGAYTEGGTDGGGAPSPAEVALFLADYDGQRDVRFSAAEQALASAAATWVMAYNARCGVSVLEHGLTQPAGSPLQMAGRFRGRYLSVRW